MQLASLILIFNPLKMIEERDIVNFQDYLRSKIFKNKTLSEDFMREFKDKLIGS